MAPPGELEKTEARKSVVQIYFPDRNTTLAYYNDRFDLKRGDLVYVDGCLEGVQGRVEEVNYNFKIKLSEYKRVIAVIDTTVHGELYMAGSHFAIFDRSVLPKEKIFRWFLAPAQEEDEYVSGNDDSSFLLEDLSGLKVSAAIAERGKDYYVENRVKYLCVDEGKGYAIVEGREAYEVEFEYHNGEISGLVCSCFCSYYCKHEVAVMLQLRETLEWIRKYYIEEYERTGYFAAICKGTLFSYAVADSDTGKMVL